jgi:hypothetical protein
MLRTGKTSALRREAPPVAEDVAITVRSAISAPPSFRKLHCSGQKQPNSLVEPNWSDTTAAGCGQVCRARPCTHRVAAHALRSAVVESDKWHSRWRDEAGKRDPAKCCWLCGGVGMREQPTLRFSLRCEAGCRLCFRDIHTTHIVRLVGQKPPTLILFVPTTPRTRDPSARN